jgi:hypothetical protein
VHSADYKLAFSSMLTAIIAAIGPFVLNGAMEFTNWFTSISSTAGKRFLFALLSLVGVIAYSALNGTPLDVNSVSSIATVVLTTAGAFLAAHGSYSLITGKTAPQL